MTTVEAEPDLAAVHELAAELGRMPGRPLIMRQLGVTDARARTLIALARQRDGATMAPAGDLPATQTPPSGGASGAPAGATGFYMVAIMAAGVSVDTSWRYFGERLGIVGVERVLMFGVLEAALVACGYGMRANVRRHGHPGAPRLYAWLLCGLSGYMALHLSGPAQGLARVALGPVLGLVMLHLALGIEIRATAPTRTTTWTRIARELRERALSRLGLADDTRDAAARTRDRAARRAARLTLTRVAPFRAARIGRAIRASGVAHDPDARARLLAELAALRHAADLATLRQPSPWKDRP